MEREKSGECSASTSIEEQIEHSKVHWSLLAEPDGNEVQQLSNKEVEEVAEVSNVEVFRDLEMDPTYHGFFCTFNGDDENVSGYSTLVMGKKFAEGGQAELYDAYFKWWSSEANEEDKKYGRQHVLKVFKKGTFLQHLKSQLPQGLLQFRARELTNWVSPTSKGYPKYHGIVYGGTLLKDGRFAFMMEKEHFDLGLIEHNMNLRNGKNQGPFSKEEAEYIMYRIALGVDWLHGNDIIHRDLKASNVLGCEYKSGWPKRLFFVADYECSVGVVGTGFFRAPEILQACKERNLRRNPEVFLRAADVYCFGMTCYEVLTGKLPFEDHPLRDNCSLLIDLVINEHLRPEVPEYVEDWTRALLNRCWEFDPAARPTIQEILIVLSTNSIEVKRYEKCLKETYGENFRFSYKQWYL